MPPVPDKARNDRFFGRRVMEFQNWTLASNAQWRLTDEQLALLWQAEFPNSRTGRGRVNSRIGTTITANSTCGQVTTSCNLTTDLADVLLGTPDLLSDTALTRIRPSTTAEIGTEGTVPRVSGTRWGDTDKCIE